MKKNKGEERIRFILDDICTPENEAAASVIDKALNILIERFRAVGLELSAFEVLAYGLTSLIADLDHLENTKNKDEILNMFHKGESHRA